MTHENIGVASRSLVADEVAHGWVEQQIARIERVLAEALEPTSVAERLSAAMRYTTLGGGKRIRPLLSYAAAELLQVDFALADAPACAIELIHTYSLVHDDLPAMDNDDLRRGKPTVHKAYDEATAILAGDALLTLAFATMTHTHLAPLHLTSVTLPPAQLASATVKAIELLADAAGLHGMVGGQALDMAAEKQPVTKTELEQIFCLKTGRLIHAAIMLPACYAENYSAHALGCLDRFARLIGLAFQIHDDVLDIEAPTAVLGKPQGSDVARGKSTYPSLVGLSQAKAQALTYYEEAMDALTVFGPEAGMLAWLGRYIVFREF